MMMIEVMTVEKSCERACAHCPYARKDRIIGQVTTVDEEVQKTFSFLEQFLNDRNIKYCLGSGVPSLPMLQVKYPRLIKGAGFQINDMEIYKGIENYSLRVKELLKERSIKPQFLTFPIATKSHLLSEKDAELASSLINELKSWFFVLKRKLIMLTFDHDFGVRSNLEDELDEILKSDKLHLLETLKDLCPFPRYASEKNYYDKESAKTYITAYESKLKPVRMRHEVYLEHRVISPILIKEKNNDDVILVSVSFDRKNSDVSLLIDPVGVMLTHSTVHVNNPIFWVSHKDFRESFTKFQDATFLKVSDILAMITWENKELFKKARNLGVKNLEMTKYFEENRHKVF